MIGVTNVQFRTLKFIQSFTEANGWAPTIRDMCEYFGWASTNAANDKLRALVRKGMIARGHNRARTAVVTEQGLATLGLRRRSATEKPLPRIVPVIAVMNCTVCGADLFTQVCPICCMARQQLKRAGATR